MGVKQSFFLALKSLATSKMRALLTMLGIIIGVAAVIVIISLGDGMQKLMSDSFNELGANLIQVSVQSSGSSREVDMDDMYDLVEKNPKYLSAVSPYITVSSVSARTPGDTFTPYSVVGVSEAYDEIRALTVEQGRFLQYVDVLRSQKVCVVGSYVSKEYYNGNALGKTLGLSGYNYTIVGVLSESAESRKGSADDLVIIPYTNAQQLNSTLGSSSASYSAGGGMGSMMVGMDSYMFSGTSKDTATASRGIIENFLEKVYGDDQRYMVITSAEMLDMMNTMMDTMMVVLVAIAGISLLVGGIGIMNIMLVSVSERTREIGIRKSLGAKRRDIRGQFIIEAGTTSAIGGLIGIALGIVLAKVAGTLINGLMNSGSTEFTAVVSLGSIAVAFGVSVGVGILFGYLPANKAAKLNPIDALRYE
ncbi:ABC transporter permease [Pseudoflavonifractor phocaeensis]|jgi:putative ABC transport system permease protein|uniref:ABC transporter permease n=1 Tax=Pseudoflavonifractor phocaeensis TaxID=1870988 RepID=UPI0025A3528C|nr:ABC transporter permease [Pseudoflavonifractor phocaeensis]MDM8238507.1 ABC transporter permease [Pseudoflavonifractor phocaeensis]